MHEKSKLKEDTHTHKENRTYPMAIAYCPLKVSFVQIVLKCNERQTHIQALVQYSNSYQKGKLVWIMAKHLFLKNARCYKWGHDEKEDHLFSTNFTQIFTNALFIFIMTCLTTVLYKSQFFTKSSIFETFTSLPPIHLTGLDNHVTSLS